MVLQGCLAPASYLFSSGQSFKSHSQSPCIGKLNCLPTVAIGIIVSLGGVFLLLTSHHILLHEINATSEMGIWGQVIDYGIIGLGLATIGISIIKKCAYRDVITSSTENKV